MNRNRRFVAALAVAYLAASPAIAAQDNDPPDDASLWVGGSAGGGGARFEGDFKGVFDAGLEVGYSMGDNWAINLRVLLHGTPDVGFGVIGGLLEFRRLFSPGKRLSPYVYTGAGYGFGGRGETFLSPLGRIGLGARYNLSSWLYAAPETFISANTAAISVGGTVGIGILF